MRSFGPQKDLSQMIFGKKGAAAARVRLTALHADPQRPSTLRALTRLVQAITNPEPQE